MKKQGFWERTKNTVSIRAWSLMKVPLINMMRPCVEELSDERCSVLIPLGYWTKNHFKSLYISAQVTGADLCAGLLAMHHIKKKKAKATILFKDLHADFKKRPDSDTLFTCKEGKEIRALISKALLSGKRENRTVTIQATCPKKYGETVLSEFQLTLSVKPDKTSPKG